MSALIALTTARDLIAKPQRWTKHHYARDGRGNAVDPDDETACRFCASGAVQAAACGSDYVGAMVFLAGAMRGSVSQYNDSHNHREVMGAFLLAIKAAEEANGVIS